MANRHRLLIAKKQKSDSTHCCNRTISEKNSKQGSDKIHCYDRLRHTGNVKVRTKVRESGSYENNFSELALQQKMFPKVSKNFSKSICLIFTDTPLM